MKKINNARKPVVFFLMGPTASEKTKLAIALKQEFSIIDLISVDSGMIYKKMNIGTSKPNEKELLLAPHKIVNIKYPFERYSVYDFCNDVSDCIKISLKNKRVPFLVGGTMFYFNALVNGLSVLPASDFFLRDYIFRKICNGSFSKLFFLLKKIDPDSASRIHKNDTNRIFRALEVFYKTGQTITSFYNKKEFFNPSYTIIQFCTNFLCKSKLNRNIKYRLDKMLKFGFIEEVEDLLCSGHLKENFPGMRCIGYRQVWEFLNKKLSFSDMRDSIFFATCKLAKRQITWLKSWKNILLLDQTSFFQNFLYIKKYMFEFFSI